MQTDRGWAWVVLVASMGCQFMNGVMCYFVGVVHTGLLQRFQASVTTTAWVGALYSANMSLTAPLAGVVISRFGCRTCCVAGGLLCFAGFTASAFVPSIAWLFVTYGMFAGVGLGMTYSPTIISIGYYFDKFRGLASGVSTAFAAIGILSGSLIAQTLIDEYSVSGAFLMIAALSLHLSFFGMFFRPTDYELKEMKVSGETEDNVIGNRASMLSLAMHGIEIRATSSVSIHKDQSFNRPGYGSVASLLRRAQINHHCQSIENTSLAASMRSGEIFMAKNKQDGGGSCSVSMRGSGILQAPGNEKCMSSEKLDKIRLPPPVTLDIPPKYSNYIQVVIPNGQTPDGTVSTSVQNLRSPVSVLEQINEDMVCSGSLTPKHESEHHGHANEVTLPEDDTGSHGLLSNNGYPPRIDDIHSMASRESLRRSPKKAPGSRRTLKKNSFLKTVDNYLVVLTNKPYMCHCASVLVANIHIGGVYLHLPEYVLTLGTSPTQAAALFVAVGLSSLVSRLATGFATTDPKIEPLTLNIGMMGLCGLGTAFFPAYAETYMGQLAFSAVFGLYTGGLYTMVSLLTVHFMGLSLLPTAFGVMICLMGVGYVSGPPLAALIVDSGGTYEHSFIFLGFMMILGAVLDLVAAFFSQPHDNIVEEDVEIASINRDWLGSSIVISVQDTASAHAPCDVGSMMSVRSRYSQDAVA